MVVVLRERREDREHENYTIRSDHKQAQCSGARPTSAPSRRITACAGGHSISCAQGTKDALDVMPYSWLAEKRDRWLYDESEERLCVRNARQYITRTHAHKLEPKDDTNVKVASRRQYTKCEKGADNKSVIIVNIRFRFYDYFSI